MHNSPFAPKQFSQCKLSNESGVSVVSLYAVQAVYMLPPSLIVFFVFLLMFNSVLMSVTIREKMIVCKKSRARPLGTISLECWAVEAEFRCTAQTHEPRSATHPSLQTALLGRKLSRLSTNQSPARWRRPITGSDFGVCARGWWATARLFTGAGDWWKSGVVKICVDCNYLWFVPRGGLLARAGRQDSSILGLSWGGGGGGAEFVACRAWWLFPPPVPTSCPPAPQRTHTVTRASDLANQWP